MITLQYGRVIMLACWPNSLLVFYLKLYILLYYKRLLLIITPHYGRIIMLAYWPLVYLYVTYCHVKVSSFKLAVNQTFYYTVKMVLPPVRLDKLSFREHHRQPYL